MNNFSSSVSKIKRGIGFLLLLLLISTISNAQNPATKLVKDAFEGYRTAILNDKGEEAAKFVDSRTIKYYDEILEKVKTSDSVAIASMSLLDKLMILAVRHRTSKEDILSFDGTKLLVYAIKKGMVGKNSVAHNSIGEVTINGNFAKGQLIANKQKAPFYFHFYKEDNRWKLDLTSIFSIGNMAFKRMVDESGQEENEYLLYLLEMMTGKKPTKDIWLPVKS